MALTKVSGGILDPGINVAGIVTATGFDGPFVGGSSKNIIAGIVTATSLDINGNGDISGSLNAGSATFSGNVSIGGTLTYEDVKNVDSVGLGTFREGIFLPDNKEAKFGNTAASPDFKIYSDGTNAIQYAENKPLYIKGQSVYIQTNNNEASAYFNLNGSVQLYYDGSPKLGTAGWGAQVTGILKIVDATDSSGATNHLAIGASNDLKLFHDGNHNRIHGSTGFLDIYNSADLISITGSNRIDISDDFIRLRSRDGSDVYMTGNKDGLVDLYYNNQKKFETQADGCHVYGSYGLQIYGGLSGTNANAQLGLYPTGSSVYSYFKGYKSDSSRSAGLTVYDGSNCYLDSTGTGSGGAVYLRAYGTGFLQFQTANVQRVKILDSGFVGIGSANPSALLDVNKGTQASIQLKTTDSGSINSMVFAIGSATNQIYSRGANSSTARNLIFLQGSTEVLKIDTAGNLVLKDTVAQGNSLVNYIQANDVNGAPQYILGQVSTGNQDLYLQQSKNANLRFQTNASTRWKIDGDPGHLLPEVAGAVDIGSASAEIGNVYLADDKKIFLGNEQDVQIYHSNHLNINFIKKSGTGPFNIDLDGDFVIRNAAGTERIKCVGPRAEVELKHTGTTRLTTTTTGITVGGEVAASQDYPDFRPVLDLNFMQNRTLDPRVTYTRDGTASYVDETGRLRWVGAHVPRFDHDPITGKSKGLLIEESRTNIFHAYATSYLSNIPQSTYNTNANSAIVRHSDDVLAPDGSRTTTKLYWDGTHNSGGAWNLNGYVRIGNYTGELTAGTYVFSFFVKRGTDGRHNMDAFLGFDGSTPTFGTGHYQGVFQDFSPYYSRQPNINGSDATIQKFPNGWYRCISAPFTADQSWTPDNAGISHYILGASYYKTYYEAMPHYYWGFQLEKADFATSYIGSSLQEQTTRGADITMINGENFTEFYNPVESTIVVNYTHHDGVTTSNIGNQPRVYNFRAPSGSDTRIDYVSNTNYNPYIAKDGSTVASISDGVATVFDGGANRTAVRVKEDSFATCFNGTLGTGDTSGAWNPTNTITEVSIGGQASGSAGNQLSGHIQRFMYYPVGLPDSQLVTLTS